VSNNYFITKCVFVGVVTFSPSRCLANAGGYTYRHRLLGGIMRYAAQMASCPMIFIPNLIKIGSGIRKLMGEGDSHTRRQHGDRISLLFSICFSK
jgi:hypothetical protein